MTATRLNDGRVKGYRVWLVFDASTRITRGDYVWQGVGFFSSSYYIAYETVRLPDLCGDAIDPNLMDIPDIRGLKGG